MAKRCSIDAMAFEQDSVSSIDMDEVSSPCHRSLSLDPASELSTFEQMLPKDAEEIKMVLPRGMRFALSSRIGGYGKKNRLCETNAKKYSCFVEPCGRKNMVKEILRYGNSAAPDKRDEFGLELPKVPFDDAFADTVVKERHGRAVFRKERLKSFNTHRHVPALVTESLVPCWRSDNQKDETPASLAEKQLAETVSLMEGRAAHASKIARKFRSAGNRREYKPSKAISRNVLLTPTLAAAMKRVEKKCHLHEEDRWQRSGKEEAKKLLHPIVAALDNGGAGPAADELRELKLKQDQENRRLWLSHDVKPGGRSPTPAEDGILEVRQGAKTGLNFLMAQYEKRRRAFQNSPDSNAMRSFDAYCEDHKAKAKAEADEKARIAEERAKEEARAASLGNMLSLGISNKHRASNVDAAIMGVLAEQVHHA